MVIPLCLKLNLFENLVEIYAVGSNKVNGYLHIIFITLYNDIS